MHAMGTSIFILRKEKPRTRNANRGSRRGAADGTRTRTEVEVPADFKSAMSTDSITAAYGLPANSP